MICQNLGVVSLESLRNLLAEVSLRGDFNISAWVAALWSRDWPSSTAPKMSLMSFTIEEVTVVGLDASFEMMKAAGMPLGVVVSDDDDEEDGLEEDGADLAAAVIWGACIGAADEGMVIFDMGTCG